MAQKLLQTKRDYIDRISKYMYENHISYKTLEETKETWRQEREYDVNIEQELITKSLLFMSLLDKDLDLGFRTKVANFIARYLSVYTSKSPECAECATQKEKQTKAYNLLHEVFAKWLDGVEAAKEARKIAKKAQKKPKPKPQIQSRTRCSINKDGSYVQTIKVGGKTHTLTYPNMAAYKRDRDLDCARIMAQYQK